MVASRFSWTYWAAHLAATIVVFSPFSHGQAIIQPCSVSLDHDLGSCTILVASRRHGDLEGGKSQNEYGEKE